MRAQQTTGGLTPRATAGNNVVLLGFDLAPPKVTGLLGFGIHRTDHTEGEQYWLPNQLGFPGADTQTPLRTDSHPVQTFRWGDYTAKPDHDYTYRVVALTGSPDQLTPVEEVSVSVRVQPWRGVLAGLRHPLREQASRRGSPPGGLTGGCRAVWKKN